MGIVDYLQIKQGGVMKHSFLKTNYKKNNRCPKTLHRYIWWLILKYKDTQFVQKHELELIGIPIIIYGLEYHCRNFFKIEQFKGVIFIVFVCRGPIPLTSDFDIDVKKYLQNLSSFKICQRLKIKYTHRVNVR